MAISGLSKTFQKQYLLISAHLVEDISGFIKLNLLFTIQRPFIKLNMRKMFLDISLCY